MTSRRTVVLAFAAAAAAHCAGTCENRARNLPVPETDAAALRWPPLAVRAACFVAFERCPSPGDRHRQGMSTEAQEPGESFDPSVVPAYAKNPVTRPPECVDSPPRLFDLWHCAGHRIIRRQHGAQSAQAHESQHLAAVISYLFDLKEFLGEAQGRCVDREQLLTAVETAHAHAAAVLSLAHTRWSILISRAEHPKNRALHAALEAAAHGEEGPIPGVELSSAVERVLVQYREEAAKQFRNQAAKTLAAAGKSSAPRATRQQQEQNASSDEEAGEAGPSTRATSGRGRSRSTARRSNARRPAN